MQEAADQMEGGEESRVVGHVQWQVYRAYIKAVGTGLVLFVLLSLALMQVSCIFYMKTVLGPCILPPSSSLLCLILNQLEFDGCVQKELGLMVEACVHPLSTHILAGHFV